MFDLTFPKRAAPQFVSGLETISSCEETHPNIAKVFDAGTTETGRPYFVMELVRGVPITEFCDSNHLTTQERLDLFISVCQAVQHAHQRGIIHRDIKPSNIMVTLHDGEPVVKVIDFGIAKAVNQQLTEKTVFTRYSQMIGTPEQAEMSGLDIDTRTDVFSLGVLLYELLTAYEGYTGEDDIRGWEWRYLWEKAEGDYEQRFRGHEHWVVTVAFSPDGKLLASGSEDQSVIVRNEAGKILFRQMTNGTPDSVSFSEDGLYLATGTNAGEVCVWKTKGFKLFKHFADQDNGSAHVEFSPSDSRLAIIYGNGLLRLWDCTAEGGGVWLGQSTETLDENGQPSKGEVGG